MASTKTLLQLALRQDEAKLQKERRIERWIIYVVSAGLVAGMAVFLAMMIYARDDDVMTGWDFAIPIVGAAAALLWGGAMYVGHRAQALREQRFGESLRDQLNRRIAQLDYQATTARLATCWSLCCCRGSVRWPSSSPAGGSTRSPSAIDGYLIVGMIFMCVFGVAAGVWAVRRRGTGSCCRASAGWRRC